MARDSAALAVRENMLARGVQLLQAYRAADEGVLTLNALIARTGLPKPTVHRLANQLTELGLLERQPRGYALGLVLLELSELVPARRSLRDSALPYMQDLYSATQETVHLGVRADLDVVYAEKIRGHQGVDVPTRVGGRLPLSTTGLGKTLLAFADAEIQEAVFSRPLRRLTVNSVARVEDLERQLANIRDTGMAREAEEAAADVACIACPVFVDGEAIAAMSLSFSTTRRHTRDLEPALRAVTAALSRQLSGGKAGPQPYARPASRVRTAVPTSTVASSTTAVALT